MSNKRGRPTLQKKIQIEKKLREYFSNGFSANATSQITGINVKTVLKYFNRWYDELIIVDRDEFEEKVALVRNRFALGIELQLEKLFQLQNEIEDEINQYKRENNGVVPHGKGMYKERKNLIVDICKVIDGIGTLLLVRTEREVNEEGLKKFIIKKLKGDESDKREVLASYDINEQEVLGSQ